MPEVLGTFSFLSYGSLAFPLGWYFSWIRVYFLIHPYRSTYFSHRDGFRLPLGLSCLGSHKPSFFGCFISPDLYYRSQFVVHKGIYLLSDFLAKRATPILSFISTWSAFLCLFFAHTPSHFPGCWQPVTVRTYVGISFSLLICLVFFLCS